MQFNQVIGQHSLKQNLINSVKSGNLAHAQLFLGNEGTGALAIALAYIQYIVCEEKGDYDSCGKCSACKKVQKLIHPDIHFSMPITKHPDIDYKAGQTPHSDEWIKEWRLAITENPYLNFNDWMLIQKNEGNAQLNINKNECTQILKFLSLKSFESGYKFMIIWMAEYLGNEGNRLLKQIEEPEEKTIFILIAENYEQILGTIQSRTQLIKLPPLLDEEIANGLIEQKQIEPSKALTIAALADGNYRAALQLLVEKDDSTEKLFLDWMQVLIKKSRRDWAGTIELIAKLNRDNTKYFLKYGLFLLRKSMMHFHAANSLDGLPEREVAFCKYLSSRLSIEQANELMDMLNKMHFYVERNAHTKSLFMYYSFAISNLF